MDLDFTGLKYRVDQIPQGTDLIVKFRELADIKEFSEYTCPDRNYLIRYIFLVYDPGSPLIKKYTDLSKRKEIAAEISGYERNVKTGKFKSENIYKVFEMSGSVEANEKYEIEEYQSANPLIFAFLKHINNMLWAEIVINEQLFFEYSGHVMEEISGKDSKGVLDAASVKMKLREEMSCIRIHIGKLYKEFFGDNIEVQEKIKPFKPETIKV